MCIQHTLSARSVFVASEFLQCTNCVKVGGNIVSDGEVSTSHYVY